MGSRRETIAVVVFTLVIVAGYSLFYLLYPALGFTPEQLVRPLSWVFLVLSHWMVITWWRAQGTVFDPYILFLFAAIAFNGGHMLLETAGLNRPGMLRAEFSDRALVTTITFVSTGLIVFHAGALTAGLFRSSPRVPAITLRDDMSMLRAMRVVGVVLLAGSFPLWVVQKIGEIRTVLSGGYIALYQQQGTGLSIVSDFFIPGSMLLLIGSKDRSLGRWCGIAVILLNALVEFFLGSRTHAMWPLLGLVWAYHRSIRALPRMILVGGGIFALAVIFPTVKAFRGLTGSARMSFDVLLGSYTGIDNPLVSIVSEMGYSMVTVAYTLQLVPETKPFDYGAGYFYAATTIVPSVTGGVHPAIARGTAAQWLIETVAPATAQLGGGLGFSFLAEAYYNFGWAGGLLTLFFIGVLMTLFFVRSAYSGSPFGIAVAAIALSFLTYYARGESVSIIRSLVWYTLVPSILVSILASSYRIHASRARRRVSMRGGKRSRLLSLG